MNTDQEIIEKISKHILAHRDSYVGYIVSINRQSFFDLGFAHSQKLEIKVISYNGETIAEDSSLSGILKIINRHFQNRTK